MTAKNNRGLFLILFSGFFHLQSQDDAGAPGLVTDRPGAPTVISKGSLQVETGGLCTSFEENDFKEEPYTYKTALLRYGLLDNFELRLGWNLEQTSFSFQGSTVQDIETSVSPLLLGMKVSMTEEKGWFSEIVLIGHIFLPFTANKERRPEFTSIDFRFAFNHTLSEKSGIAYNMGAQWSDDSPEIAHIYT